MTRLLFIIVGDCGNVVVGFLIVCFDFTDASKYLA